MTPDSDLMLWIKAAIPPKPNGHVDRTRAAQRLGISERTLSRWLADPTRVPQAAIKRLHQLAILRGHGTILWPQPPAEALDRDRQLAEYATRAVADITNDTNLDFWNGPDQDRLQKHTFYLIHYPRAHVYGTSIAQHAKSLARLKRAGARITEQRELPNYWMAQAVKMTLLQQQQHKGLRCVTPKSLVPIGRSELWRETTPTRHQT